MPVNEVRYICQLKATVCKSPSIHLDVLAEYTGHKSLPSDPMSEGTENTNYSISRDKNNHITVTAVEAETGVISVTH